MPQTCYIYTLHASNDPECRPRYVGFTINPKSRQISHNRLEERGRKAEWVRSLRKSELRAVLTVIYRFRSDDLCERGIIEATWIDFYRRKFSDLLNDMGGGHGLIVCSESVRKNMSRAAKLRCADPAYREKVSATTKQVWKNPEMRARMSAANKQIWDREEVREKQRNSCKRRWADPAERAKKSESLKRFCASPEVRAKMSERFKKAWENPELRAKAREERKRRWEDPEYRAKISAAKRLSAEKRKNG